MTEQTRKELEEKATELYGNLVYPKTHIELYIEGYIAGAEGYEKQKNQLTKAKEIVKQSISRLDKSNYRESVVIEKLEQFLKEIEK